MTDLFAKFDDIIALRQGLLDNGRTDPFNLVMEKVESPTVAICNGKRTILLGTYNYMGMTFDPDVVAAGKQALDEFEIEVVAAAEIAIAGGDLSTEAHSALVQAIYLSTDCSQAEALAVVSALGRYTGPAPGDNIAFGRLARDLWGRLVVFGLEDELETFWFERVRLPPLRRWMRALREVALPQSGVQAFRRSGVQEELNSGPERPNAQTSEPPSPLVLFIDEIDAVRGLPFSTDEFFAAIREGREPNASVAGVLPCYQVLHDLEQQLDS